MARMSPREIVKAWVEAFNRADVEALTSFYRDDAINHQVAEQPVEGRDAIREMFATGFAAADMVCIVEHIFEDGEWAILESVSYTHLDVYKRQVYIGSFTTWLSRRFIATLQRRYA